MSTTISESNLDTSELDAMEQEAKSAISKLGGDSRFGRAE